LNNLLWRLTETSCGPTLRLSNEHVIEVPVVAVTLQLLVPILTVNLVTSLPNWVPVITITDADWMLVGETEEIVGATEDEKV
jgi:hypothetical protein